jgi:hypothetical protein
MSPEHAYKYRDYARYVESGDGLPERKVIKSYQAAHGDGLKGACSTQDVMAVE